MFRYFHNNSHKKNDEEFLFARLPVSMGVLKFFISLLPSCVACLLQGDQTMSSWCTRIGKRRHTQRLTSRSPRWLADRDGESNHRTRLESAILSTKLNIAWLANPTGSQLPSSRMLVFVILPSSSLLSRTLHTPVDAGPWGLPVIKRPILRPGVGDRCTSDAERLTYRCPFLGEDRSHEGSRGLN